MKQKRQNVNSKLPSVKESVFATMSALAAKQNAINLSQGFPDFPVSETLAALVYKYMKEGHNQYAPMQGIMPLREVIAEKKFKKYNHKPDPETEITITAGATQAIYTAITAFVREGDEVIVLEPAYDCYVPSISLNGGIPVFLELELPDYTLNWEKLKKMINHRTRMIIINTPHNPTGTLLSETDMKMLDKIVKETELIVLSDEVYEHIIFNGEKHQSVLSYPNLAKNSLAVFSFGKTFHNTGWKSGYCIAPEHLTREFRKVHQFIVFSVNTPVQYALADFISNEKYQKGLGEFFSKKRDYFMDLIKDTPFHGNPAKGTYFQLLDFSDISREKDTEFAIRLTKEAGVASIPVSPFYRERTDNKVLRFCFAKSEETLEKAAKRLKEFVKVTSES